MTEPSAVCAYERRVETRSTQFIYRAQLPLHESASLEHDMPYRLKRLRYALGNQRALRNDSVGKDGRRLCGCCRSSTIAVEPVQSSFSPCCTWRSHTVDRYSLQRQYRWARMPQSAPLGMPLRSGHAAPKLLKTYMDFYNFGTCVAGDGQTRMLKGGRRRIPQENWADATRI